MLRVTRFTLSNCSRREAGGGCFPGCRPAVHMASEMEFRRESLYRSVRLPKVEDCQEGGKGHPAEREPRGVQATSRRGLDGVHKPLPIPAS